MNIKNKLHIASYEINKRIKKIYFPFDCAITKLSNYKGNEPLQLLITGVPRSGTSFITGLISHLGLSPGPDKWLKPADKNNKFGYYESLPLFEIMMDIIRKSKTGFYDNFPNIDQSWLLRYKSEIRKIKRIIESGGIEIYKENKLLVYSDLYHLVFPSVKWLFIKRNFDDTYKSQFGSNISKEEFKKIYNNQLKKWYESEPSKKALYINYEDFKNKPEDTIESIIKYLNINPKKKQIDEAKAFFKPSK